MAKTRTRKRVVRKADGRIRKKRSDTSVGTVRKDYAPGFTGLHADYVLGPPTTARQLLKKLRAASDALTVKAAWDDEARVWYTEDSSLPGLNLEAETLDELRNKLPGAIEDLLEGDGRREVPFELITPGLVKIPA
jgi:hypothetical protein